MCLYLPVFFDIHTLCRIGERKRTSGERHVQTAIFNLCVMYLPTCSLPLPKCSPRGAAGALGQLHREGHHCARDRVQPRAASQRATRRVRFLCERVSRRDVYIFVLHMLTFRLYLHFTGFHCIFFGKWLVGSAIEKCLANE